MNNEIIWFAWSEKGKTEVLYYKPFMNFFRGNIIPFFVQNKIQKRFYFSCMKDDYITFLGKYFLTERLLDHEITAIRYF